VDQRDYRGEPGQDGKEGAQHASSNPPKFVAGDLRVSMDLCSPIVEQIIQ
jgi:hypothetical protein